MERKRLSVQSVTQKDLSPTIFHGKELSPIIQPTDRLSRYPPELGTNTKDDPSVSRVSATGGVAIFFNNSAVRTGVARFTTS